MMNRGVIVLVCFASLLAGVALVFGIWTSRVVDRLGQLEATVESQADEITRLRQRLGEDAARGGLKLVISERDTVPSRMPLRYANYLNPKSRDCVLDSKDVRPEDFMSWRFYGGTREAQPRTRENTVFFIATEADAIRSMMEGLGDLDVGLVHRLRTTRTGCLLGRKKLESLKLQVGDRFLLAGLSHKEIDLEFEVLGELPGERYENTGIMNPEYLDASLAAYERKNGKKHPFADSLNLVWLRVRDWAAFERVKRTVESSPLLAAPHLTCHPPESLPWALLPDR